MKFYQLPTVISLPTICYLSREKPLVKPTGPGSSFSYICLAIYFFLVFIFRSIKPKKYKNTLLQFLFILSRVPARSIYPNYYNFTYLFTREGLTTPLLHWVASICSLCASTIYVVLHGSFTGSITLVSSLREIPTVAMLHHPFLPGENTDADTSHHLFAR